MYEGRFECEGITVHLEDASAQNPHMLIEGMSGSGKSVCLQYLLRRSIGQGDHCIVFNFSSDDLNWLEASEKVIKVKLECEELVLDALLWGKDTATNFISGIFCLLEAERRAVGKAIEVCLRKRSELNPSQVRFPWPWHSFLDVAEIVDVLSEMESKHAVFASEKICGRMGRLKLSFLMPTNRILTDQRSKIQLIETTGLSEGELSLSVECILQNMLLRGRKQKKHQPTKIFIDEFQHVFLSANSALGEVLTEGRKLALGLCVSTQFVSDRFSKRMQNQLEQSAMHFYFRPSPLQLSEKARRLGSNKEEREDWREILQTLKIGEFVLVAPHRIGEGQNISMKPRRVKLNVIKTDEGGKVCKYRRIR